MRDSENIANFKLIEIKNLDYQFIDRIFVQNFPNEGVPIINLAHNQELIQINSLDYLQISNKPIQTFNGSLGKILAVFEDNNHEKLQIFNEKSEIQIIANKNYCEGKGKGGYSNIKVEQDEDQQEMEIEDNELNQQRQIKISNKELRVETFASNMFLPYGIVQSINQCFFIVCGAHSFTSQQITNILIMNDSTSTQDPYSFLAKCIKNLEKSVYKNQNEEGDSQKSLFAMMPFNWDDVLFYILKNQNEFVDILKISLLIYDQQKDKKKFQQDEKFEEFLNNLNISPEILSFINEKLLLFLTSIQKQQFKDYINQQKQTIISNNFQKAFNLLKKNHHNSAIFKRISKEVKSDLSLSKIISQSNQKVSEQDAITCIITNLDINEEPILKCKNCKHFMIDLKEYLKTDASNTGIDITTVFSFRNNICTLCCGLVVPLIP